MNQRWLWIGTVMVGLVAFAFAGPRRADGQQGPAEPQARQDDASPQFAGDELQFFEQQVQPLLKKHCLSCHGTDKPKGGLQLLSRETLLRGGDSGPAAVPGKPDESLLIEAVNYASFEMPPKGKLAPAEIETLTAWVRRGLPWTPGTEAPAAEPAHRAPQVNEQTRAFWSFQPVQRPPVPDVADAAWVRNPIDAFVLARLEAAGLRPAPPADKLTLIRRATYDLTGLPPTPDQIDQFLSDERPEAFEALIDRLLESPQYGEKWGRHWLDLVRYAETNSYERDNAKPFVWRYRDYVIRAWNEDKPFDQFIIEQLAGDELQPRTPDALIATGYYRLGIWDDEPVDPELALYDDLDDILTTTSQVFLGLTINCARCHDHKIDPIPQRDYYRMLAFLRGLNRFGVRSDESVAQFSLRPLAGDDQRARHARQIEEHQQRMAQVRQQIEALERLVRGDFSPVEVEEFRHEMNREPIVKQRVGRLIDQPQFDEYRRLRRQLAELRAGGPPALEQALCVTEVGPKPRDTWVLIRGNPQSKGDPVEPGFPSVLNVPEPELPEMGESASSSGRRMVLARWIASPRNPLTSRVLANRLWQYHFGRGLVRSANDFGFQGDRPTHPELLDWLASELVAGDWRLKRMHKLMMLSATYRMSSAENPAALAQDPTNDLLWRFDMRRLSAEEIRDSILAVNGSLNLKLGGPSVYPRIPAEVLAGQSRPGAGWGDSPPEERARRSVYIHVKRSLITPIIASFDGPETDFSCPVRFTTTQPTQALGMLNSQFVNEQAEVFAAYLRGHAGGDLREQVRLALQRTRQRPPSDAEVERGVGFVEALRREEKLSDEMSLRLFCVLALNLNEFLYLD
ncbi:MAG: PSD1 domain-containing protein [Pirellulaceae bacterium]|nr:PSD1 domain-containing protein [Pirellulaceae bacterium]